MAAEEQRLQTSDFSGRLKAGSDGDVMTSGVKHCSKQFREAMPVQ